MEDLVQDIFDKADKSFKVKMMAEKRKSSKVVQPTRRQIVMIDPVALQPIVVAKSLPSKGHYKKFTPNTVKDINRLLDIVKPDCPEGKIRNPKTGRCIKDKSKAQTVVKAVNKKLLEKPCPEGKIRNPKTGRCINDKTKIQPMKKADKDVLNMIENLEKRKRRIKYSK